MLQLLHRLLYMGRAATHGGAYFPMECRRRLSATTKRRWMYALVVVLIVWQEFLSVKLSSLFWDVLEEQEEPTTARVLIVADPQLIGYRNEPWLIGPFARWDADRYLQSGFAVALQRSRPDAVLFLGDLFDEGVNGDEEEFNWTAERFDKIFPVNDLQRIFVSGDNDVGGESERVDSALVSRFHRRFPDDVKHLRLGNVGMLELNGFSSQLRNVSGREDAAVLLLLSHTPVLGSYGAAARIALEKSVDLILSAHDHTGHIFVRRRQGDSSHTSLDRFDLAPGHRPISTAVSRGDPIVELKTPTCSYRMGVPSMGYGLLLLTPLKGKLQISFTVLWLHGRYPQLFIYLFVLLFLILTTSCKVIFARRF